MPMPNPAITAPVTLPIPPRMMTASPFSSMLRPTSAETLLKASPKRTPAAPPSAEEMKNDQAMMRSTSTPRMRAARGFSATARLRRPSGVARKRGEGKGERDVHSRLADERERREGAEHEHGLVGEVQDVEHAEDERVADGEEGVDAAEEDAVDRLLAHCERLLEYLELPALHLLHARLVFRVALLRERELAERRVEVLHLREAVLDVVAAGLVARLADGLGDDDHA